MPLKALLDGMSIFARDAIGTGAYTCHECASSMHYRRSFPRADGVIVQAHFAHNPVPHGQKPRQCSTIGQSEEHLNAKECIRLAAPDHFLWLRGIVGDVEVPLGNRRADVLFILPGDIRIVFEPQFTKIRRSEIAERTKDYHDFGCHVVWCFPERRDDLFTFCKHHFRCVGLLSDDGNEITFQGNFNPQQKPSLWRTFEEVSMVPAPPPPPREIKIVRTVCEGDWIYTFDELGDWRGTHKDEDRGIRTRLKRSLEAAKHDVSIGRFQFQLLSGEWSDKL